MRTTATLLLLATLAIVSVHAQSSSYAPTVPAAAALRLTSPTPAPVRDKVDADLLDPRRFNSRAPGATLMIIGGAAIVAGILVGDSGGTVLILGGIGLGAYGFYLYNR